MKGKKIKSRLYCRFKNAFFGVVMVALSLVNVCDGKTPVRSALLRYVDSLQTDFVLFFGGVGDGERVAIGHLHGVVDEVERGRTVVIRGAKGVLRSSSFLSCTSTSYSLKLSEDYNFNKDCL
ncbi:MAG: hypothetical protein IJ146_02390 [Kiritimatiellae bacterium]|nr:hypothetical protein [Kiritimatiellia bacterium]